MADKLKVLTVDEAESQRIVSIEQSEHGVSVKINGICFLRLQNDTEVLLHKKTLEHFGFNVNVTIV